MKHCLAIIILSCSFLVACGQNSTSNQKEKSSERTQLSENRNIIHPEGNTVKDRFNPPAGFERVAITENSFAEYLRNLKLKPIDSPVLYYNGKEKQNNGIYVSVIDMDIDAQDLQQCADAAMRLRGEYLFKQKKYAKIHFNFLSDGKPRYFTDYAKGDYSYRKFRAYMRYVFSYANTASLHNEMKPVLSMDSIAAGDVFIQKRQPYGHAVIVMDVAVNKKSGKKLYLLAQSYMPAQETQILANPTNSEISPWYEVNNSNIRTPEWTFKPNDLRRFNE